MSAPAPTSDSGTVAADKVINVGTRKSILALKQTEIVVESLKRLHPEFTFEIHSHTVIGDRDQTTALYNFGGKGLWTSELEAKLAGGELDMIVHSLKDMPTTLPDGCVLGAVSEREDPRDVVVFKASLAGRYGSLADLPAGSVVGTSSMRRIAQVKRKYPALRFEDVRGNIQTRLRKLDDDAGPYAAIVIAAAGLLRMDMGARIGQRLESETGGILHAVGQGAIGVEARAGDERVLALLRGFDHRRTRITCEAERSLMRALEGGCSVPIGVETSWPGGEGDHTLRFKATVVHVNGEEGVDGERSEVVETAEAAEAMGVALARDLVAQGAQRILDDINKDRPGEHKPLAPPATSSA